MKKIKAQSIIEYSIILGLVASVFFAMQTYLKRGIQAGLKISADRLGIQEDGFADTDPREGQVETSHQEARTPEPNIAHKNVFVGGEQVRDFRDGQDSASSYISEQQDDGWYYIKVGRNWELRRKSQ